MYKVLHLSYVRRAHVLSAFKGIGTRIAGILSHRALANYIIATPQNSAGHM